MKLLVDSDFLVGLFRDEDVHHARTGELFGKLVDNGSQLFVCNLVLHETGTVLAHRVNMDAVRLFHKRLPELELRVIDFDGEGEKLAWRIFLKQTKKGCSFVDCANLALIEVRKFDGILSFDKFYPKDLRKG